jgi:hypothetical protein
VSAPAPAPRQRPPAAPAQPRPARGPSTLVLAILWILALGSVTVAVLLYATR